MIAVIIAAVIVAVVMTLMCYACVKRSDSDKDEFNSVKERLTKGSGEE